MSCELHPWHLEHPCSLCEGADWREGSRVRYWQMSRTQQRLEREEHKRFPPPRPKNRHWLRP